MYVYYHINERSQETVSKVHHEIVDSVHFSTTHLHAAGEYVILPIQGIQEPENFYERFHEIFCSESEFIHYVDIHRSSIYVCIRPQYIGSRLFI